MSITDAYKEQMVEKLADGHWGASGAKYDGDIILEFIRKREWLNTVLDFGAGQGALREFIVARLDREIEWTDFDPGIPGIDEMPTGTFDLVVSTDVLEHIEPQLLDETLFEMKALTGKCLINDIACYPTGRVFMDGPYKGQDIHLTIDTPTWWRAKFEILKMKESLFSYRVTETLKRGAMVKKTRCLMVHEIA